MHSHLSSKGGEIKVGHFCGIKDTTFIEEDSRLCTDTVRQLRVLYLEMRLTAFHPCTGYMKLKAVTGAPFIRKYKNITFSVVSRFTVCSLVLDRNMSMCSLSFPL